MSFLHFERGMCLYYIHFPQTPANLKWVQLTVRRKTFQEQEVNNAGIPLRVHITIVVHQVNVLQTRFIIYCSAQYWG